MAEEEIPYRTEYAKSSRSACKLCKGTINKDSLRMAKMVQAPNFDGKIPHWYHYGCFFKKFHLQSVAEVGGLGGIRWEDQQMIKDKVAGGESTDGPSGGTAGAKRKKGGKSGGTTKKAKEEEDPLEKELREQSELVWKVRDQLSANLTNAQMKAMLERNEQEVPSGESKLLDRCSDGMVFGALEPCGTCGGQLVARTHQYCCTGNISDWTKCTFSTTGVKRKRWHIPKELKDGFSFLKKYKYEEKVRVFPKPLPSASASLDSIAGSSSPAKPLEGFTIRVLGNLGRAQKEVVAEIKGLGGSVVTKVSALTTVCISSQSDVEKKGKPMKEVERCDIPVVDVDFLEDVAKGGGSALDKITPHKISPWGAPRLTLPSTDETDLGEKSYEKVAETVKMTVKGGAVIDPDSGLESTHHVLESSPGSLYSAVLGMVDVVRGTNSYYKLQLLESDTGQNYRVFRSWGRVGTTIGGTKTESFYSEYDAKDEFKRLYFEKTGNSWKDRKKFEKVAGKFYPLEIDYGQDDEDQITSLKLAGSSSKLAPEIQDLIRMIFDIETMKKALVEFEIDTKKMPLGKLSRRQIERAYMVLTNLLEEVKGEKNPARLLDGSNQFYTLIPHDFGMQKPPVIETEEVIKQKTLMLDNLMEIEFAYSILKSDEKGTEEKDPLDIHYEKLHTDLEVVSKADQEYGDIKEYVKNTHGITHSHYSLDVMEVFKVLRHGEEKRFKPFAKFDNRMLLWHGSRLTNFVGILSQGLRIAPPEAPMTGYMFGKGVYFADMVSKSANYCWTSQSNPIGLMLLCEVALGDMYEKTSAEFITQLPPGKHSTKGLGRTAPDTKHFKSTDTGAVIPLGKGITSSCQYTSLQYNEYIVYDVAQIRMKYLVKMNFKY